MAKAKKTPTPFLIDLACGNNKREGYWGVDEAKTDAADQQVDLEVFPWPWEDGSVDGLHCSHYVEHAPMYRPDGQDGLIAFMNECHRILRKPVGTEGEDGYIEGGRMTIIHPDCKSTRAFQDPTHRRFIPQQTWYYFNREWMKANALDHYPITADFDVIVIQGLGMNPTFQARNAEMTQFALTHHWEAVADLQVELRAR